MAVTEHPEADPFDLLCHLAFNAPLCTRRERANRLRKEKLAFFAQYSKAAQHILEAVLEQYAQYGPAEIVLPDVLRVPMIAKHGNVLEIAQHFGGTAQLREAANELQALLYAA